MPTSIVFPAMPSRADAAGAYPAIHLVRSIKSFHRQLLLSHGVLVVSTPLRLGQS